MSDSDSDALNSSEDDDYVPSTGEDSEHENDGDVADNNVEKKAEPEIDKKKVDEVWESFKNETKNKPPKTEEAEGTNGDRSKNTAKDTVTVTKVYDFAGEEVKVTKTVAANSVEAKTFEPAVKKQHTTPLGRLKRSSGGIHSVLGKLGKKPKLSTLEKSKLDWQNFKEEKGIHEELDSYKKGKDGYLEKQSFLQRTDIRQFEKERDLRLSRNTSRR